MRKLENVLVTHVSYVDKAANKKSFFLTKSGESLKPTFETEVKLVTKADDPQKLVYGVVYEPNVEDVHGDYMDAETIEKAAHGFMADYQQIDKQHDFTTNAGKVVESYVAPVDMNIGDTTITKGTWVLVTKATDEMWESIQKGDFTGYSLAGTAQVEDVRKQTAENYKNRTKYRELTDLLGSFNSATWEILDDNESEYSGKVKLIQDEVNQLSEILNTFSTTKSVTKQGLIESVKSFFTTHKSKEDEEMTEEQLKKALGEALKPVNDRLSALEKGDKSDEKPETANSEASVVLDADAIAKAVSEAVAPLNTKIENLEKSRISNNNEPNYTETVEKSVVPSYVDAVFPISE
ncbi:XkdF-like putative serine protease domain-containing protein [Enterococcus casseliflavus]|uniref:XkdF-like putative serine protease domain-containing protein n=1 Tax=Enterococcus casseliflavus TaxID=37734 RepID=UPI001157C6DF|nr:XkdF-like putative serine protease domain-containing protein [Enterococcus casseliflavus]